MNSPTEGLVLTEIDQAPLGDKVYHRLRSAILEGVFPPGRRLVEVEVAEQLGVSRTPVREAFQRLAREGLVTNKPRKGIIVEGLSPDDALEVSRIREVLEGLAAALAAERMTEAETDALKKTLDDADQALSRYDSDDAFTASTRFHAAVIAGAHSPRLERILNAVIDPIMRYRRISMSVEQRRLIALPEHRRIYEAISNRDPEEAERAARDHARKAAKQVVSLITELETEQ